MMRIAVAVAPLYPQLNLDLLTAGILFHDSGKLWENHLPENGFTMGFDERGELMGHISIGIELVNTLWRKILASDAAAGWKELLPASEDVRLHLLHLIGSHHGEPQFGSPVSPKTPEAMALNYIDNMDARLEMFRRRIPDCEANRRADLRSCAAVARQSRETACKLRAAYTTSETGGGAAGSFSELRPLDASLPRDSSRQSRRR
jgi:3'-5' exoribonuclease